MKEEVSPEEFAGLLDAIADKKARLDRLRPLSPAALANLDHYYDVEITYASNAIEGNTRLDATLAEYLDTLNEARPPRP
jgi:hypothetical protein